MNVAIVIALASYSKVTRSRLPGDVSGECANCRHQLIGPIEARCFSVLRNMPRACVHGSPSHVHLIYRWTLVI